MRATLSIIILLMICAPAQALDPGNFPIVVYANEDYRLNLTHKSYTSATNLTGYSFKLQAKKSNSSAPFLTFSSAVTNAAAGQTTHWITRRATADRSGMSGIYDLMQTAPNGTISYKLKGTIQIMDTVTR